MSHEATNWAIAQRGLKPGTKIVLWELADCHNAHTRMIYPKQSTLAARCEMSRSTINKHLDILEERGLIRRTRRVDSETNRQQSTLYELALDFENTVSENETRTPEAVSEKREKPCPDSGH